MTHKPITAAARIARKERPKGFLMDIHLGNGQQTNGMDAADLKSWTDFTGEPVRTKACTALGAKEPCTSANTPRWGQHSQRDEPLSGL